MNSWKMKRNEFLDQKIIGSDIFNNLGGAIVKVLCCFASEVMISEMVQLPQNGSLRAIQWIIRVDISSKQHHKGIHWSWKHRYRHFDWVCRCHSSGFMSFCQWNIEIGEHLTAMKWVPKDYTMSLMKNIIKKSSEVNSLTINPYV